MRIATPHPTYADRRFSDRYWSDRRFSDRHVVFQTVDQLLKEMAQKNPQPLAVQSPQTQSPQTQPWVPPIEVGESATAWSLKVRLPGVAPDTIEIKLHKDTVTIAGQRQRPETNDRTLHYSEFRYGAFQRSIQLPEGIDAEMVQAVYTHGILELTLPKRSAVPPTIVKVQVNSTAPDAQGLVSGGEEFQPAIEAVSQVTEEAMDVWA